MSFLTTLRRRAFPAGELLAGLAAAHVIATLQVYASNRQLYDRMAAVAAAGFLPVPNGNVMPELLQWQTAACGGVLFTLSVGAGLSLLSVVAAWAVPRATAALCVPCGILAGLLVLMNSRGFDPWVTLYFTVVPPLVFTLTRRFLAGHDRGTGGRSLPLRLIALGVVAAGWAGQYDRDLFIDLRDHLLMSNPPGQAVSAFYYRYTLYPAEAFKSLDQKQLRTVEAAADGAPAAGVRTQLIRNDYLPVNDPSAADVEVAVRGDRAAFSRFDQVLEVPLGRWTADPRSVLSELSAKTDRLGPFRAFTFYTVLLAFPSVLFFLAAGAIRVMTGPAARGIVGELVTAVVCALLGLGLLAPFQAGRVAPPSDDRLQASLSATDWPERVAGLKAVRERNIDLFTLAGTTTLAESPHVPERYWLARALGGSKDARAGGVLLHLLEDPSVNVRTMALEAIGQRRDRSAVGPVLDFLNRSHEWYDQMYAYQTLRALGWSQSQSR